MGWNASQLLPVYGRRLCYIAQCNTEAPPTDDRRPAFGSELCHQCKMAALTSGIFRLIFCAAGGGGAPSLLKSVI